MLQNIQQRAHNHVNNLVTDRTEVDEFEDDAVGNFSIEVLCLAVQHTYGINLVRYTATNTQLPSRFIICEKGDGCNHFFALHGVPGDKWLLKDSLYIAPYLISNFVAKNPKGGMHHICIEVEDINTAIEKLNEHEVAITGTGKPKIGAHGKPVVFLHPKDCNGTLIELEEV